MIKNQTMDVLTLAGAAGVAWLRNGWALLRQRPLIWLVILFAYLLISMALYVFLPLIGLILFYLVDPIFVVGFMLGCRALDTGHPLEVTHLFAAFRRNAARLVTIGGINLIGRILIFGAMGLLFVNSGYMDYLDLLEQGNFEVLLSAGVELQMVLWLAVLTGLMLPLYMAYWFAPALVEFDEIEPVDAMRLSFLGCLRNLKAFLVYGLAFLATMLLFFLAVAVIGAVLGLLAMLLGNGILAKLLIALVGLGLALLCWIGVQGLIATTQYASYLQVFRPGGDQDGMMAL